MQNILHGEQNRVSGDRGDAAPVGRCARGGENGEFSVWKDNEQIYERKECTDPFPSGVDIVRLL